MRAMQSLATEGLLLEPLVAGHAEAMFPLLSDAALYRWIDEAPPADVAHLRARYARLETRVSADGRQHWLNWVVRRPGQPPLGYLQATVLEDGSAWVAYLLGSAHQGRASRRGRPRRCSRTSKTAYGATCLLANVEAENAALDPAAAAPRLSRRDRRGSRPARADGERADLRARSARAFRRRGRAAGVAS